MFVAEDLIEQEQARLEGEVVEASLRCHCAMLDCDAETLSMAERRWQQATRRLFEFLVDEDRL